MSENTKKLLLSLGEDPNLVTEFKKDPKAVMSRFEVPADHQEMIIKGDKEGLKEAAGLDDAMCRLIIF